MTVSRLVVASTFAVHPALGGGQLRIRGLYRQLARFCPVDVIALTGAEETGSAQRLDPGLTEVRIPKTHAHAEAEARFYQSVGVPITDIAFSDLYALTPAFGHALAERREPGTVFVASHPYAWPAIQAAVPGGRWWYDAHNVEADLKETMLPRSRAGRQLLDQAKTVERDCVRKAELVLACSAEDSQRLTALYGVPAERLQIVPNGVDVGAIGFTPPSRRRILRGHLRLRRPMAIFIGSWHEPNVVAARHVLALAAQVPGVTFTLAGSVGIALREEPRTANVELMGTVSDPVKSALLGVAEVALNPMVHGSGTNMKMLDYIVAGVPVISTAVGVRGLGLTDGEDVRISDVDDFHRAIEAVLEEPDAEADRRAAAARRKVTARFDWSAVSAPLVSRLQSAGAESAQTSAARLATTA